MPLVRLAHRYLVRQTFPWLSVPYYDRMLSAVAGLYLGPLCRRVLERFPGPASIVDAGSGPGHLAVMLAEGNPECIVTGIDLARRFVALARRRADAHGVGERVSFVRGNLEACPLPDASADLVVSTCSLHHWRRPVDVLIELRRLLKPGGELWLMDNSADAGPEARAAWTAEVQERAQVGALFRLVFRFEISHLAYSREELVDLCDRAGLALSEFSLERVFFIAHCAPPLSTCAATTGRSSSGRRFVAGWSGHRSMHSISRRAVRGRTGTWRASTADCGTSC